ncbi:hypothetical protein POTOM_025661 [Populus tomentosa]|uniref:J domain-containing protein n=1 Tax=Populus tomentosa TaxID=118781 RepID=A0A8X7ZHI0_POPTO|nr:hypothetical protein POTOM_025661 [Populus tomentosa]
MDGNKDDALKCLGIGKEALESGDRSRALKFITKARRLDPTLAVDDLLSAAEKDEPNKTAAANINNGSTTATASTESKVRQRGSSSSSSYTEEQILIVREIRKKKNYYEILGLEKSCSVEDVRKAYRKLSLKVHPDKNKSPGAEDAFKAVSKAFQCLSNEESRSKYDVTGTEEHLYERRSSSHNRHGYYNYNDDLDPDEIFRQFFFGAGMRPATTQFRSFNFGAGMGGPRTDNNGSGFNFRALIQLLPVLLIFLFNFLPSSEPIYALSRSYPYEYRFTTQRGVNFYVKSTKFEKDYLPGTHEREALEAKVEKDYVSVLVQNCRFELQRKQWGFVRETPHCEMLQQFQDGELVA